MKYDFVKGLKQTLVLLFSILIILTLLVYVWFVWFFRPLIPTTRWQSKAETFSGASLSVKTYKWFGFDQGAVFVRIKNENGESLYVSPSAWMRPEDLRERWFKVLLSKDKTLGSVSHVGKYPYLNKILPDNTNHEKGWGDILNNATQNENWELSRLGNSLVFSNAVITVSVSKK